MSRKRSPNPGGGLLERLTPLGRKSTRAGWREAAAAAPDGLPLADEEPRQVRDAEGCTRAIRDFAREFYRRRMPGEWSPAGPAAGEDLEPGIAPIVRPAGSATDQLTQLAHELRALRDQGTPLSDVLVLVAGQRISLDSVLDWLRCLLGPEAAGLVQAGETAGAPGAGVAHLTGEDGKGSPIVFVLGLDEWMAEELNSKLGAEARRNRMRENTELIYAALTRARERLVVYGSHPRLLGSLCGDEPERLLCA